MKSVRIGINATSLSDRPSGARQRFVGLYGALFRARPDHEYWIYEPSDCRVAQWFAELPNVRGIATPLPSGDRWKRFRAGLSFWRRLADDRLNLFESLHLPLISAPNCPTLLTVHDIRAGGDSEPWLRRTVYRRMLRQSLRSAQRVITVSHAMKAELALVEPRAAISTIYNGIDVDAFRCASDDAPVAKHYGLPSDFLLSVGHFEPRKNYGGLLAAFHQLVGRYPQLGLAIVGRDGGTLARTAALVRELGLQDKVRLLHDVGDDHLAALYRQSRMVVFPSTYEGFGIPLLEAMAAGRPLALSDLGVFRELTENRSVYFPPRDPTAMAAAIAGLIEAPSRQQEMIAYGRRRSHVFAFERLAEQLDALHMNLVGSAALAIPRQAL